MRLTRLSSVMAVTALGVASLGTIALAPTAGAVPNPYNTATTIIIDSSGSMGSEDPNDLRKDGASTYLDVSLDDDEVGIVDFDSSVQAVQDPVPVKANRATLDAAIASVDSSGGTDLGVGLAAGCASLQTATATNRAAIFLTDGYGSYVDEAACFAQQGWPVYAIALGDYADEALLQQIADDTNGRFIKMPEPALAVCVFGEIRDEIGGGTFDLADCQPDGSVTQGTSTVLPLSVSPGLGQISITLNFAFNPATPRRAPGQAGQRAAQRAAQGTDLMLTLTDPNGTTFSRSTGNAQVSSTQSSETLTIQSPVGGQWSARVTGVTVPNGATQPFSLSSVQLAGGGGNGGGGSTVEPPGARVKPVISGTPKFGETLSVSTGEWDQEIDSFQYQWLRGGSAIVGATSSTYTLGAGDVGQQVSALVTARPVGAPDGSAAAEPVLVMEADAPVATTAPSLVGLVAVDRTVTADPGVWSVEGLTFSYEWLMDGVPFNAGGGDTLRLTKHDVGKAISVRVTAEKEGYQDGVATSGSSTVSKAPNPGTTELPEISGVAAAEEVLQLSRGVWSLEGLSYSYQWLRDGNPIPGATNLSYQVQVGDIGREISAVVTAAREGYEDGEATAAGVVIEKVATTVESSVKNPRKLRFPKRARVLVSVASELLAPEGDVAVMLGQEVLGTKALPASGSARVRLPKMEAGRYVLTVMYLGDDVTAESFSTLEVVVKPGRRK